MNIKRQVIQAAVGAAIALGAANGASAESRWDQAHPRRAEVNHRLHHQAMLIRHERREGEITRAEARSLHRQDHAIRHEERRMAALDHGHITRAEQHVLNQQENAVSHEIRR
jgi:hypothetical protein